MPPHTAMTFAGTYLALRTHVMVTELVNHPEDAAPEPQPLVQVWGHLQCMLDLGNLFILSINNLGNILFKDFGP